MPVHERSARVLRLRHPSIRFAAALIALALVASEAAPAWAAPKGSTPGKGPMTQRTETAVKIQMQHALQRLRLTLQGFDEYRRALR